MLLSQSTCESLLHRQTEKLVTASWSLVALNIEAFWAEIRVTESLHGREREKETHQEPTKVTLCSRKEQKIKKKKKKSFTYNLH